jgi:radical SAM superfamily enzyme YgiQ (UPF0313 family)
MEKILFIVPPHIKFESFVNPAFNERAVQKGGEVYGNTFTDMPIGVLSLSAYVKKHAAAETKLIDFNVILNKMEDFNYNSFSELFREFLSTKEWTSYAPSIIGISVLFTPSYQSTLDIARCCRDIFPNAIIIAGGGVATNMYSETFRDSICFDALCYGEGEKPLLALVNAANKLQYIEENSSWITRKKVENGQLFQHNFIEDLDEIPFYDYDILNTDEYCLNPTFTAYNAGVNKKNQNFHVMTSRGCPHKCCFCSSHTIHGRRMRYHSLSRVREDFKRLKEQYGARTFVFQDDHLMADKRRALEIINLVKELQVAVVFQNSLALYALDKKILEALKDAGINQLVLSVESGSDRVLKEVMHKPLNLSIVKQVVSDCRELGIYTNANILIGLPGETKQDIEDARAFLKTINADWFLIYCANPLIGSEMYDICKKNNYLKKDYIGFDYKKAVVETEDFTAEYIQEMAYFLNLELNFVENSDYKLGNYKTALNGFENTIKVREDHAFAYYFAAKCLKRMNLNERYLDYKEKYEKIIKESEFWKKYVNQFNLSALK